MTTSPGSTVADLLPKAAMEPARPLSRLAVLAALLLAIAVATAIAITSAVLSERAEVVRLTQGSLSAERLLSDLKDAERAQRGFLLTGQPSYLQPYGSAVASVRSELAGLRRLVVLDGVMAAHVAALERLLPKQLDELERTIALRRRGDLAAALESMQTGQGQALMDAARAEVAELGRRAARAAAASDLAIERWVWAGTLAALAFLIAGVALGLRLTRERQLTRLAVSRGEVNLRAALDAMPQMVWSARADGRQDYYNRRWYEFTGTSTRQATGEEGWFRQLHPDDRDRALQRWRECLASAAGFEIECRLQAADGTYVWTLCRALPVRDPHTGAVARWYGTCTDIDELTAARSALSAALAAKEVLLQEVNHRVKNSLQLVSSLLTLQAARVRSPELKGVLADARARLSVIARLHQRLYEGGTHASVDLLSYLEELCADTLAAVQREPATRLAFRAETRDGAARDALWPLEKAVPIALIVAELVTNAVKHAFPDGGGELRVGIERADAELRLLVEDDGPGLPEGFDPAGPHGVGMRVVTALVRQLGGSIRAGPGRSGTGAAFSVVVPGAEK